MILVWEKLDTRMPNFRATVESSADPDIVSACAQLWSKAAWEVKGVAKKWDTIIIYIQPWHGTLGVIFSDKGDLDLASTAVVGRVYFASLHGEIETADEEPEFEHRCDLFLQKLTRVVKETFTDEIKKTLFDQTDLTSIDYQVMVEPGDPLIEEFKISRS